MLPELVTAFLQIFKTGPTFWGYVDYTICLYLLYNSRQLSFVTVVCCRKATVRTVDLLYPVVQIDNTRKTDSVTRKFISRCR